ncbi:MAG: 23S rRNA (pseudouridine(1915)-N(3))-methyltransferase RlmH [Gemmatimonadaceae bacterium]
MRMVVAVVGKPRSAAMASIIHDYEKRAARYWPLDVQEVREERAASLGVPAITSRESQRLEEKAGSCSMVACNPGGRSFTSLEFSAWLQSEREREHDIAFLIGGAHGLSDGILERSTMRLSLAPWTLPHELARLVLAEQLYRAGSINRGEPYHK